MATGSLYQPPGAGELQSATEEERRLQELLFSLEGRSRSYAPLNSGKFAVLNLDPLSDALRESRLREKLDVAKRKKQDIQGQYLEEVARQLRQFQTKEKGETQVTPLLDDKGEAVTNQLPGNPMAFEDYLTSPYPEIRRVAENREKDMDKLREALGKRATFKSLQQGLRDPRLFSEQPETKITEHGIYSMMGGQPTLMQGTTQVPRPGGAPDELVNRGPAGNLSAVGGQTINIGEQKADTQVRVKQGTMLAEEGAKLAAAFPSSLRAIDSAEQAIMSGTVNGPMAKWEEAAFGVLGQLGLSSDSIKNLLSRSELRNSDIGRLVLAGVRTLGANPSNADRMYYEMTAGGRSLSRDGQLKVLEAAKADLANSVLEHNSRADRLTPSMPAVADSKIPVPSAEVLRLRNYAFDPDANMYRLRTPAKPAAGAVPQQADANSARALETARAEAISTGKPVKVTLNGKTVIIGPDGQEVPDTDWTTDPAEVKRRADAAKAKYLGGR